MPIPTLTFYGAVGEIGGNKILLTDNESRVFLDFGMNFEKERRYYEPPYLQPRNEDHLLGLGILPALKGLYKNSAENDRAIDAILVSHPHLDHYGYLKYVRDDIPVICGETTKTIILAKELSGPDISGYKIANLTKSRGLEIFKEFVTFRTNRPPSPYSPVSFNPIHVDHSVPGAYGLIMETSGGNVVYTGDFRLHGPYRQMSEEFIRMAKESEPASLIIEGTNIVNAKISSEEEVRSKIIPVIEQTSGLAMAGFSMNDIDRLNSFHEAAQVTGRKLAVSMKQAYLLHKLKNENIPIFSLEDLDILIFTKGKKKLYLWEQEIAGRYGEKIIDAADVERMQHELLLTASFYDMNELIEIKPIPGSTYILSQSEPFNEEMEIDFGKLLNWLVLFGIPQYQIHVSGHALPYQLKWAIKEINAKKVFLVHTERPELYKRFLSDLNIEIISPEEGKEYVV